MKTLVIAGKGLILLATFTIAIVMGTIISAIIYPI